MNKIYRSDLSNIHPHAKLGDENTIHSHVWIGEEVILGNRIRIQAFVFIPNGVRIEDDVFIGPRVTFINDPKLSMDRSQWEETLVKQGVKIGACATIQAGVTIGKNAIIGAGSLVLHDIPDNETWVGVPARKMS